MKKIVISALFIAFAITANGQETPSKGLLVPRMTTTERTAITSPAEGIIVFDTDTNATYQYVNGAWVNSLSALNGWSKTGNASTDEATDFIGTTDNKALKARVNNVNIFTLNPFDAAKAQTFTNPNNNGTNDVLAGLDIIRTINPATGTSYYYNFNNLLFINPTSNTVGGYYRGGNSYIVGNNGAYNITDALGFVGEVGFNNSGITGSISTSTAILGAARAQNNGATYQNMSGLLSEVTSNNLTGAGVRNAFGLKVGAVQANGTGDTQAHNAYGIFIQNQIAASGGTTNRTYSIFSDSTAPSSFAGNIGIGTATPSGKLHVVGGYSFLDGLRISGNDFANTIYQNTANTNITINTNSNNGSYVGFGSFLTGVHMAVKDTGNVGIGNTTPKAKLDVSGYIKVGSSDTTADAAPTAGLIRFNSSTNKFQGYTGTAWVDLN